jgi:hypothetical protein
VSARRKPGPPGPRTDPSDIASFVYKHISAQISAQESAGEPQKAEIEAAIRAAMAHFRVGRSTVFKAWKNFLKAERGSDPADGAIPDWNWRILIED